MDCEHREAIDITPWHGDVFDHPEYKYVCQLFGSEVIPFLHCRPGRCPHLTLYPDAAREAWDKRV